MVTMSPTKKIFKRHQWGNLHIYTWLKGRKSIYQNH